jgi:hypothetical protein
MKTKIDSLTIKDFESRYGVARSNIYNRIDGLKKLGYAMEPEKLGGKSIFNADQLAVMDRLDAHLKTGEAIATFPGVESVLSVSQDKPQSSYRTQDRLAYNAIGTKPYDAAPAALGMASLVDAIVTKLVDAYPQPSYTDPLANLRMIQEACDRGWLLSSGQLAPLLGRKSLPSKDFDRYGFRFVKAGKNGAESAWRIEK